MHLSVLTLALIFISWPAVADDHHWHLRGSAAWVDPSVENSGFEYDEEADLGFQVSVERRFSPIFGVELGALYGVSSFGLEASRPDGSVIVNESEVTFPALTAALNLHIDPGGSVDFYLGPVLAYLDFADVSITASLRDGARPGEAPSQISSFEREASGDLAWGAQIGADINPTESPWGLHVSIRYFDANLETSFAGSTQAEVDFDPLIFATGFIYQF